MTNGSAKTLYASALGEDSSDVSRGEARNGAVHVASLSLTKTADGLIDPKLVLAWLMGAVGAPAAFVGLLVPIREAGALLPQLALARPVAATRFRKRIWSLGSALQGLAALAIAAAAILTEGVLAGGLIVAALAVLALSRSLCSISYKDALARSIPKTHRGTVKGIAGSAAAAAVLLYGGLLSVGVIPLNVTAIALAIALAGLFWLGAALLFLRLGEEGGTSEAEGFDLRALLAPLREDPQLRRLVLVRALLTATALAPPFLVMLSSTGGGNGLGQLGPLVLASSGATILSSYVWGRLSDRSSRQTLAASGALGAIVLGAAAAMGFATGGLGGLVGAVLAIFIAQIAYEGVRAGRKLHLTDMADDDTRAPYTALSNSVIGVVLLAGGALGVVADLFGTPATLAVLALLCAAAAVLALGLEEVQKTDAG
jgi:hypothetical protein